MNRDKVCIFPDTMPREEILFPLVQFFEQVIYLRPVENDSPEPEALTPFCREAVAANFITYDCPAPLGEHRERFLHLVDELQNRPDDYAIQLANLSLAGLGRQEESETKTSIISSLLKQEGIKGQQNEQREMVLWQARLVLTLGEIFDRDQATLQKNLSQISAKEQGLLAELRKDSQQPFSLTEVPTRQNEKPVKQLHLRLKAWSRLLGLGGNDTPMTVFVTASRDAFDLLIEKYEVESQKQPVKLIELELPAACINENPAEQISTFTKEAAGILQKIQDIDPANASAQDEKVKAFSESWTILLEKHYPPADSPRCRLTLYAFPGTVKEKIFMETFGRDETEMQLSSRTTSAEAPVPVIGILETD